MDGTADHIRIGAIGAAPQAIADHRLWSETRREVLRTIQTPDLRAHTEHREVAETGIDPFDALGLSGHDDHTDKETADLRTLPMKTKRTAVFLHRLSTGAATR